MGFRFHRSIRLLPGIKVNLSKTGPSLSLGGKGLTENISRRGARTTFGIPGTGLSYSTLNKGRSSPPGEATDVPARTAAKGGLAILFMIVAVVVWAIKSFL